MLLPLIRHADATPPVSFFACHAHYFRRSFYDISLIKARSARYALPRVADLLRHARRAVEFAEADAAP